MEYAQSLVLNDLINAAETSYGDCETFQILCPECKESVYKVGSATTKRQYFSHYRMRDTTGCELRVMQIVHERFSRKPVAPHGQELEAFLRRFETIILEDMNETIGSDHMPGVMMGLHRARSRPVFRRIVFSERDTIADGAPQLYDLMQASDRSFPVEIMECIRTVTRYLTSPNSFTALLFAVSFGLVFAYANSDRTVEFLKNEGGHEAATEMAGSKEMMEDLIAMPNTLLRKYLLGCLGNLGEWRRVMRMLIYALTQTATMFTLRVMRSDKA